MINFNEKKIFYIEDAILIAFFALGLIGFLNFESSLYSIINKILAVLVSLILVSLFVFFKDELIDFFATLVLFLSFYNLYNLYYSLNIPLWLLMVIGIILTISIFNLLFIGKKIIFKQVHLWVYSLALVLIILELFISLVYWPIDPKSKAIILVAMFYSVNGVLHLKTENNVNWKSVLPYGIISAIVILSVIATSVWNS